MHCNFTTQQLRSASTHELVVCCPAGTAGPALPGPSTPLESLRGRWQAAAEQFCSSRGLAPSLVGVVVSELQNEDTELPPGVHKFKQVREEGGRGM